MTLTLDTAPTELPLTLDEVKAHLRVTSVDEDADIMGYLRAAVDILDGPGGTLNRALLTQTLIYKIDDFPSASRIGRRGRDASVRLPLAPLQSVSSVTYLDTSGVEQTLPSSVYRVLDAGAENRRGRINLEYGQNWPAVRGVDKAVTIEYVAGYGARNDVPERIRHLIKVMITEMYDHRAPLEAASVQRSPAYMSLYDQCAFPGLGG
jgi:uncharacterized phiE125 gp8 family phage protein